MAKIEMDVINAHAAGIDVGSRSHFVAIGHGVKRCTGVWCVCR